MAYAAAPAARPLAEAPAPAEEARAPPTIDSHGGKLTPITCFGCGPDGVTALLVQLALLSTLAPRGFKLTSRAFDLSVVRLAPGLLFTAALGWNLLPSLGADYEAPAKFHLAGAVSDLMAVVLAAVAFFGLVSDALMPAREHSPARAPHWHGAKQISSGILTFWKKTGLEHLLCLTGGRALPSFFQ